MTIFTRKRNNPFNDYYRFIITHEAQTKGNAHAKKLYKKIIASKPQKREIPLLINALVQNDYDYTQTCFIFKDHEKVDLVIEKYLDLAPIEIGSPLHDCSGLTFSDGGRVLKQGGRVYVFFNEYIDC